MPPYPPHFTDETRSRALPCHDPAVHFFDSLPPPQPGTTRTQPDSHAAAVKSARVAGALMQRLLGKLCQDGAVDSRAGEPSPGKAAGGRCTFSGAELLASEASLLHMQGMRASDKAQRQGDGGLGGILQWPSSGEGVLLVVSNSLTWAVNQVVALPLARGARQPQSAEGREAGSEDAADGKGEQSGRGWVEQGGGVDDGGGRLCAVDGKSGEAVEVELDDYPAGQSVGGEDDSRWQRKWSGSGGAGVESVRMARCVGLIEHVCMGV